MEVAQTIDPLDALAAQHGAVAAPPAAPAAVDPLDALAAQHGAQLPTFRSENAKDAEGHSIVSGISHAWDLANTPLVPQIADAAHAIASHLDAPALDRGQTAAQIRGFLSGTTEATGNLLAGMTSPVGLALTFAGLGPEGGLARRIPALRSLLELPAVQALQKTVAGLGGAGFTVHGAVRAVTEPTVAGKLAGAAEMAAGGAGVAGAAGRSIGRIQGHMPEPMREAVAFGAEQGVPLDAATATGSKAFQAMQKRVANSMGGESTASQMIADQAQGLRRVGRTLLEQTHPEYVSPETAGEAVAGREGAIRTLMQELEGYAQRAYGTLREIEADPKHSRWVATAPEGSRTFEAIRQKLGAGLDDGQAPSLAELKVMRQIAIELESQPFTKYLLRNPERGKGATTLEHVEGTGGAGAPVYHEIMQAAPGTADMTREEVLHGVLKALEQGDWTNAGRGALAVAQQRLRQGRLGGPLLDESTPVLGTRERIGLPVDLRQAKQILTPLYERMMREKEIVPPMGDKAHALLALHRMMGGPDVASASVVDGVLSDLKTMARTDIPELRSTGQGAVAQAIKVIEPPFQEAIRKAGPEATRALEEGRGSVQAKHWAGDTLRQLVGDDANRLEPVKAFRKLVAPDDTNVSLLRKVRELAPARVPELARGYLEDLLHPATREGGFDKAGTVQNEWQRLGPQTKTLLFGAEQATAIDKFLRLARRIGENPNPSGTAHTLTALNFGSQPLNWAVAQLLYTPRGVKALTRLAEVSGHAQTIGNAARQAAWIDVMNAARAAGVDVPKEHAR